MFLLVQMFGFMLYVSDYKAKASESLLFIPKVSGFVISLESFLSCMSDFLSWVVQVKSFHLNNCIRFYFH